MTSHKVCVNWVQSLYSTSNPCSGPFFSLCCLFFSSLQVCKFCFLWFVFSIKNYFFENKGFLSFSWRLKLKSLKTVLNVFVWSWHHLLLSCSKVNWWHWPSVVPSDRPVLHTKQHLWNKVMKKATKSKLYFYIDNLAVCKMRFYTVKDKA